MNLRKLGILGLCTITILSGSYFGISLKKIVTYNQRLEIIATNQPLCMQVLKNEYPLEGTENLREKICSDPLLYTIKGFNHVRAIENYHQILFNQGE